MYFMAYKKNTVTESPEAAFRPRTRRRARHILDNYAIVPAGDPAVLEVWCYSDRFSYEPGDEVRLHISTSATRFDLEVGRDGEHYERVLSERGLAGELHPTPPDCSTRGCDWPVGYTFVVPADWRAGGYLITLTAREGDEVVVEHHLILVRHGERSAPTLLLCATGTWVAYNCWGGSNHYEGNCGEGGDEFSPVLSTQRPWTRGFCWLPAGAPRALPETPVRPGDMARYPYMEWAYAYGYSKKYASAGWASYERHFARWAEASDYPLDFASLHDLHERPELLEQYRCVVLVGHDEYWSLEMRLAVDDWVEAGGRLARFAGNFLWQIRFDADAAQQTCYKYVAAERDPLRDGEHQHLLTDTWESASVAWPGTATFGVTGTAGLYAGLGKLTGQGPGGFTVYRPEHWAFDGAQIGYGDVLGAQARIFGYEVDGLDFTFRDGLPLPTGADGADPELTILALGLAANVEPDHGVDGEQLYIGSADAEWKARVLDQPLARAARGNGAVVHWQRGRGEVFTAGSCEWVAGLLRHDPQVERVTRNVLDRFTREDD